MSDDNIRRFKPSPATESLYQAIKAHRDRAEHATQVSDPSPIAQPVADSVVPSAPSTPHIQPSAASSNSEQSASVDDIYAEFREWCEAKRTCWPNSLVEFLSYCEFMFAKDLGDPHTNRSRQTRRDYSWVPSVLCDIFHSSLKPEAMLNILEYFLSLLSVLIPSDATPVEGEARTYRGLLLRTVAPTQGDLFLEPNFLGALDPADATTPPHYRPYSEEAYLLEDIRRQLYQHLLDPQ